MTNAPSNISVGQIAALSPTAGTGGLWRAPLGSTLPTDTVTPLTNTFTGLGYIDEDGVTISIDRPSTPQYSWGGFKVASLQQHYNPSLSFKLQQVLEADVLKVVHSDTNVSVAAATTSAGTITTVQWNPLLNVNSVWVIAGFYQTATFRLAVPDARITTTRDMKLTHKSLAVWDCTLELFPDSSGNFAYQIWDDGVVAVS